MKIDSCDIVKSLIREINSSRRPLLLIGDGIHQSDTDKLLNKFVADTKIPVISSRYTHDVMIHSSLYYGYVGSHGIRYTNYIISEADLIISLGNSLSFPENSKSYSEIINGCKFFKIDIDDTNLVKKRFGYNFVTDLKSLIPKLVDNASKFIISKEWLERCNELRTGLWSEDSPEIVRMLSHTLTALPNDYTVIGDVGNIEFWLSRAMVLGKKNNRTLYSKSFGTLGNSLGKAIGAYYATKRPVAVFVGDQGIQFNIQDLHYISTNNLPILIFIANNHTSGMIRDREKRSGFSHFLHVTQNDGYKTPNFMKIADSYGICYKKLKNKIGIIEAMPIIIEIEYDDYQLVPWLPEGNSCRNMAPELTMEKLRAIK